MVPLKVGFSLSTAFGSLDVSGSGPFFAISVLGGPICSLIAEAPVYLLHEGLDSRGPQ